MGAGADRAARFGLALRRGRAALEYAVQAEDDVRHALGLRVAIGSTLQERHAAAARRADSLVARRVASEIASRQAREVSARLESAARTLTAGAFDQAADLYRDVLLWSPENSVASAGLRRAQLGAMLAQADSAVARNDWWRAASHLEHAQQLFPADSLVVAKLESVRAAQRRADRTRTEAAEEVRLGLDAYASQRYAVAARRFEAALRLDPANETAGELLQLSRSAHDAQVRTAIDRARARLQRHDPEGARAALEPAFAVAPDHAEVAQLAALIDRERDRQEREHRVAEVRRREAAAHEDRSPVPVSQPQLAATYERGMQMYRTGDLASAMIAWEEIARVAPHFEEVDRYLLRVYRVVGLENYTEGRLQEAIEVWSKALRLEPENAQVRRYLDQANAKLQRAHEFGGER
jgi:tetratricopeptide (TPR) repeat protein